MMGHNNKSENNSPTLNIYHMLSTILSDFYVLMVLLILAIFQRPAKSPCPLLGFENHNCPQELTHQSRKIKRNEPITAPVRRSTKSQFGVFDEAPTLGPR